MIHTTEKSGIVVFDRKSPRHDWQIIVATDDEERAEAVRAHQAALLATCKGWEQGEIHVARLDYEAGLIPTSLPSDYFKREPATITDTAPCCGAEVTITAWGKPALDEMRLSRAVVRHGIECQEW